MKTKTLLVKLWAICSCALVLFLVFFLFSYIFIKGAGTISWEFLTEVPKGLIIGTEGGILPAIVGSAWYTGIACLFATILGVATAIYQVFYCRSKRLSDAISTQFFLFFGKLASIFTLFSSHTIQTKRFCKFFK